MTMSLGTKQEERVIELLKAVETADTNLEYRREKVAEWIRRYEAQDPLHKDFPFVGASSVHVPMVAIARDAIMARIMNALFSTERDINCEPFNEDAIPGAVDDTGKEITWRDFSESLEEYFDFETSASGEVAFRRFIEDIVEDKGLVGTAFPAVSWERLLSYNIDLDKTLTENVVRDNVRFSVPDFDRVIFPHGYGALGYPPIPFIAEKLRLRPSQMISYTQTLGWHEERTREFIRSHCSGAQMSKLTVERNAIEGVDSSDVYDFNEQWIHEVWGRVDLFGNGKEVPLLIHYPEGDPRTILSVMPWPYKHGHSKFLEPDRYIRRKNRLLGMGIPERASHLDEGISSVVNQIIDMGTLSNTSMWGVDEDVVSIQDLSHPAPGRIVPRGDDPNAISEITMGGTKPDLFEGFNILMMLFEKLIKVSDYDLGRESEQVGSQGTATATLALMKQSGQYFDMLTRGTRETADKAAWRWLLLFAQQKPFHRVATVLGPKRARLVLMALQLEPDELSKRIGLYIGSSSDATTQELQRQQEMAKFQIMETYYRGLMELAQSYLMGGPATRMMISQIGKDVHLRMRKLLEGFGETYSNRTLPSLSDFIQIVQQQDQQAQQGQGPPAVQAELASQTALQDPENEESQPWPTY